MKFSLIDIIMILAFILVLYLSLSKIFEGSPSEISILFGLLLFLGTILLKIGSLVITHNREIGEMKIGLRHSFAKVKEDISSIKEDTSLIKDLKEDIKKLKI